MNASKVLQQMVNLVHKGLVDDSVVSALLEASGVRITMGQKIGTYKNGMLCVSGDLHSLDPAEVTSFSMPGRVIEASAENILGMSDGAS